MRGAPLDVTCTSEVGTKEQHFTMAFCEFCQIFS